MRKILLVILLFIPFIAQCQIGAVGVPNVIVTIGSSQINGSGQATVTTCTQPYYQINANVKIWDSLTWQSMNPEANNNQMPAYISKNGYFSFSLPMTYILANSSQNTVYLIQYAWGGTVLYDTAAFYSWNTEKWNVSTNMYYQFKKYFDGAKASLNTLYGVNGWNLQAVIWTHQNDAVNLQMANAYEVNLGKLVDSVRAYVGNATVPFYILRNSSGLITYTYNNTLRTAQANVVAAKTGAVLVDTDSYAMSTDNIHWNSAGQIALGVYMAGVLPYEKRLIFRYK